MSLAYLPLPKLTRCNRSILPSDYSKQGDTPSARLSKLGCGPYRRQKHTSGWTPANKIPDVEPFDYRKDSRKPKYIEKGDPLQDEEILLQGLPIVEPGDEAINTIRKVPSDQALMPLRWGSSRRATGRSKSGLQVRLRFGAILPNPYPNENPEACFESTILTCLVLSPLCHLEE